MTPAGRPRLVAILGATAAGKSALGIALGHHFGGEIVACDSTAVFRGIDSGTDKVPPAELQGVPHHLIDVADPTEVYSAARYAQDAASVIRAITARGRLPILVGGTRRGRVGLTGEREGGVLGRQHHRNGIRNGKRNR